MRGSSGVGRSVGAVVSLGAAAGVGAVGRIGFRLRLTTLGQCGFGRVAPSGSGRGRGRLAIVAGGRVGGDSRGRPDRGPRCHRNFAVLGRGGWLATPLKLGERRDDPRHEALAGAARVCTAGVVDQLALALAGVGAREYDLARRADVVVGMGDAHRLELAELPQHELRKGHAGVEQHHGLDQRSGEVEGEFTGMASVGPGDLIGDVGVRRVGGGDALGGGGGALEHVAIGVEGLGELVEGHVGGLAGSAGEHHGHAIAAQTLGGGADGNLEIDDLVVDEGAKHRPFEATVGPAGGLGTRSGGLAARGGSLALLGGRSFGLGCGGLLLGLGGLLLGLGGLLLGVGGLLLSVGGLLLGWGRWIIDHQGRGAAADGGAPLAEARSEHALADHEGQRRADKQHVGAGPEQPALVDSEHAHARLFELGRAHDLRQVLKPGQGEQPEHAQARQRDRQLKQARDAFGRHRGAGVSRGRGRQPPPDGRAQGHTDHQEKGGRRHGLRSTSTSPERREAQRKRSLGRPRAARARSDQALDGRLEHLDLLGVSGREQHPRGLVPALAAKLAVDGARGLLGRDAGLEGAHQRHGDALKALARAGEDDRRRRAGDVLDLDLLAGLVGVGHVDDVPRSQPAAVADEGGSDRQRGVWGEQGPKVEAAELADARGREGRVLARRVDRAHEGVDLDLLPGFVGQLNVDGSILTKVEAGPRAASTQAKR